MAPLMSYFQNEYNPSQINYSNPAGHHGRMVKEFVALAQLMVR
jgi:hypothetical protein